MFKGSYQKKLLTVLQSGGSNPLEIWDIKVKNGWTRRVKDDVLGCIVFEICGTNVATAYIISPPDPRAVLGITLPFITMYIKNLNRYFTFEIQILDDKQMRRRFRFSNYQSSTKVRPFTCSVPLALRTGWNQMQLNIANFTTRAYGTNYMETLRVQIHANCRIRRIFFSDRLYAEEELPRDYRIHLNLRQVPQQPSQESSAKALEPPGPIGSQTSHPTSTLKQPSVQDMPSELVMKTSVKSASVISKISRAGSKLELQSGRSVTMVPPDEQEHEQRASVSSIGSRKSQRSSYKLGERMSMSAIVEEKEPQTPEIGGGEDADTGDATTPEHVDAEGESNILQESPEDSPGLEEGTPTTEIESPRTEETESPRTDIVESEATESEPIPESDAEVLESDAEEAPPEPPASPESEVAPAE